MRKRCWDCVKEDMKRVCTQTIDRFGTSRCGTLRENRAGKWKVKWV